MEKQEIKIVRNEILDRILTLLMFYKTPDFSKISNNTGYSKVNINSIARLMPEYEWEDYMKESFEKELLFKKYIIKDKNGNLSITEIGNEFKRKGGYAAIDKKENQEDVIREKTIESFKYGKWGFYMSIIAIIVSIIALLWKE